MQETALWIPRGAFCPLEGGPRHIGTDTLAPVLQYHDKEYKLYKPPYGVFLFCYVQLNIHALSPLLLFHRNKLLRISSSFLTEANQHFLPQLFFFISWGL